MDDVYVTYDVLKYITPLDRFVKLFENCLTFDDVGLQIRRSTMTWFCNWCLRWNNGRVQCDHCGRAGGLK